jgi:polysaccharide chain length determinant protein (PEP-CTERM system associated)
MVGNNAISLADVRRVLRRWWWILPITTVFFGTLGVVASMVLPKRYTSETLVEVESPTISSKLVEPVITEDLNRRLSSMKEEILSRSRLQPIIEKLGLYPKERATAHIEDLVDRLRTAVTVTPIEPMAGSQNRQLPGFKINVTFNNGQIAQQICTEITSMFLEQNARERMNQSSETVEFFQQRLDEAKKKLDDEDAKLADFKAKHPGEMPDQEQTNLQLLAGMNTQLDSVNQAISRAQQEKTFNESLLAQQEATLAQSTSSSGGAPTETLSDQLAAEQQKLVNLQAIYTPEHPDVLKAQRAIADLKRRIEEQQKAGVAPAPAASKPNRAESPQLQQLRAKLRLDDQTIADLVKTQARIQSGVQVVQGRIQATPMVEQQFKDMSRDYQTASENYNDLLRRHNTADLGQHLESAQESEQFKILDPPSMPNQPSFPNKLVFAGGGFGGGLVLGLAVLYLLAVLDKSLHTERDVETGLKLPLLVSIPSLDVVAGQVKRAASLAGAKLPAPQKGLSA